MRKIKESISTIELKRRLVRLKIAVINLIRTKYNDSALIILKRIDRCIKNTSNKNLSDLAIYASDLNEVYNEYHREEELIDYIYYETNDLADLQIKNPK